MRHRGVRRHRLAFAVSFAALCGALGIAFAVRRQRSRNSWSDWRPPAGLEYDTTLHARVIGAGPPIVLLHGLTSSQLNWGGRFDDLSRKHTVIACDLLGFGHSPRPPSGYTANDHADAVVACLHDLGIDMPAVLVGHSVGALVALRLAARYPKLVTAVVAIAPPIYRSPEDARRHIRKLGLLAGLFALDTPWAKRTCTLMCRHRALAALAVGITSPGMPNGVAQSTVQHSWASYSQTLKHVLIDGHPALDLQQANVPIRILVGNDDEIVDIGYHAEIASTSPNVSLERIDHAGHELPRSHGRECIAAITALADDSE